MYKTGIMMPKPALKGENGQITAFKMHEKTTFFPLLLISDNKNENNSP